LSNLITKPLALLYNKLLQLTTELFKYYLKPIFRYDSYLRIQSIFLPLSINILVNRLQSPKIHKANHLRVVDFTFNTAYNGLTKLNTRTAIPLLIVATVVIILGIHLLNGGHNIFFFSVVIFSVLIFWVYNILNNKK
jgi:hypothetical protein